MLKGRKLSRSSYPIIYLKSKLLSTLSTGEDNVLLPVEQKPGMPLNAKLKDHESKDQMLLELNSYLTASKFNLSFEDAQKLVSLIRSKDLNPPQDIYKKLIMAVARNHLPNLQSQFHSSISDLVDLQDLFIHADLKSLENRLMETKKLHWKYRKDKISLNVFHYTTLMNTILINDPSTFLNVYNEFKDLNMSHSAVMYSVILRYYFNSKKVSQAQQLYEILLSEGQVTTNVANVMIEGLFKLDKVSMAFQTYHSFHKNNIVPDCTTFGTLIHHCTKKGMHYTALGLYNQLKDSPLEPTLKLYSIILYMYTTVGNMPMAEKVYEELKLHYIPNKYAICIMMQGYSDLKRHDRVTELYKELENVGITDCIWADRIMVVTLASNPNTVEEAIAKYATIYQRDLLEYTTSTVANSKLTGYYIQLAGCFKYDPVVLKRLYADMWFLGLPNQKLINHIITSYIIQKHSSQALKWAKKGLRRGEPYTIEVYRKLLGLYCDAKLYQEAVDFIGSNRHIPTVFILHRILEGFRGKAEFVQVAKYFERFKWDRAVFKICLKEYVECELVNESIDLMKRWVMNRDVSDPDLEAIRKLWKLVAQKGNKKKLVALRNLVNEIGYTEDQVIN